MSAYNTAQYMPQGGGYAARSAQAYGGTPQTMSNNMSGRYPNSSMSSGGAGGGQYAGFGRSSSSLQRQEEQEKAAQAAEQTRLLTESTRRVQEAIYYMRLAMDADDVPTTLDKAAAMLNELGDSNHRHHHHHHHHHHHTNPPGNNVSSVPSSTSTPTTLSPKNYYELHMRASEELPNLEEFFLSLTTIAPPPTTEDENGQQEQQQQQPNQMMEEEYQPLPPQYTMAEIYRAVQYCPRVVPRLYLQICAGSALIRSGEQPAKVVLKELIEAVKCVQCPIRGLFLRHYLLQATKDKLPDDETGQVDEDGDDDDGVGGAEEKSDSAAGENGGETKDGGDEKGNWNQTAHEDVPVPAPVPSSVHTNTSTTTKTTTDEGTVQDSYKFVLDNFIEMNKLWVRIQHLPISANGSTVHNPQQKNKEAKKKRERERNELRVLVGTNLVRLSQLEGITSTMYGTIILPKILDQITACRDPLAQAYLMDCIIQVFPDEFHIQTLEILLAVCPRLREKVNVRTILQSVMDRLANYYADELLLNDEEDVDGVKTACILDSIQMFEDCIKSVFVARGVNVTPKEVIRLQASLMNYSMKCNPGNMDHVNQCLEVCMRTLRGEGNARNVSLDTVAMEELEKLLSVPMETLGLKVLELEQYYSELLTFLPRENRRSVAVVLLKAVETSCVPTTGGGPDGTTTTYVPEFESLSQIEHLFNIIKPLVEDEGTQGSSAQQQQQRTTEMFGALGIHNTASSAGGAPGGVPTDPTSPLFQEEQLLVAKLIHLLDHEDTDIAFDMICITKKHLENGGRHRLSFTIPPLIFKALKLLNRVLELEFGSPVIVEEEEVVSNEQEEEEKEDEVVNVEEGEQIVKSIDDVEGESETNEDDGEKSEVKESNEDDDEKSEVKESNEDDGEKSEVKESNENDGKKSEVLESNEDDDGKSEVKESNESDEVAEGGEEQSSEVKTETEEVKAAEIAEEENEPEVQTESKPQGSEISTTKKEVFLPFTKTTSCRKILIFIQNAVSILKTSNPDLAFNLSLQVAATADQCGSVAIQNRGSDGQFSSMAYEFMSEAFMIYEGHVSDSRRQQRAIVAINGTLLSCKNFDESDYDALVTKTAQYAARLLKKTDQCKMVMLCSHLFFNGDEDGQGGYRNPQRVLECLQRSLKIADACTMASPTNVQLFVDILDRYIYFYERENPVITDRFVSGLIALISEHMGSIQGSSPAITDANAQFRQIVLYIKQKKADPNSAAMFAPIVC